MKKAVIALMILAVLAAAAGGFLWWRDRQITLFANQPYGSDDPKLVDIPSGSGPRSVATLLVRSNAASDADLLYAYLRREKLGPLLKAGEYEFQGELSPVQVVAKIIAGQVKTYRFTVPEGLRVEEALPILAQSELGLNLQKLTRLSADREFLRRAGVPANSLEGYLFPDTYLFTRGFTEEAVLTKMISRAFEEYRKADEHRKSGVDLNLTQTITLASIIEKETAAPEERPRISCVFHNRLRVGMKLQTDPTVLYALRLIRGVYINNITAKDLLIEHPYNTYTTAGLPPGPIASPGAASIEAALSPIDCNDLYFVSRNNGTHVFCPDLKCHNAAVELWQRQYFRQKHRG